MRTNFLCSLILCLGGAAGACSSDTGSDPAQQADAQANAVPTVTMSLTGLT